jgi:hypothetical protein
MAENDPGGFARPPDPLSAAPFNPWLSMWTRPRRTLRRILDSNPGRHVLLLAMLLGVSGVLDNAVLRSAGDALAWPTIVLIAVVAGPIGGVIGIYLWGWVVHTTGRWLKGRAAMHEVRAAIAWGNMPALWALPLYIPEIALFGQEQFTSTMPRVEASPPLLFTMIGLSLVEVVIGVWAVVTLIRSVAEAQRFGAWMGLANVLLALLVLVGAFLGIALLVMTILRPLSGG